MICLDSEFIIKVADFMLPRPSRKLYDYDGSELPVITVTLECFE